jgi:putative endonuclease
MPEWSVYLLRCGDGSFYTGIATDVTRRIGEHERGKRGAKYLRGRGPFELVYARPVGDRSTASRIEYRIKRLSREQKTDLVAIAACIDATLDLLTEAG